MNNRGEQMKSTEIAEEIAKAPLSLKDKLSWHLTLFNRNVPESMIPVLQDAVRIANEQGFNLDKFELVLPDDVQFKGESIVSARTLIDNFKLHYYITTPEVSSE
jgi:hypothetical protein